MRQSSKTHFVEFIGLICLITALIACHQPPQVPEIPADYSTWNTTTDIVLDYPIPGHESHFRKIYINPLGETVRITKTANRTICNFPEGTIIVKEIYDSLDPPHEHQAPDLLTVMIKNSEHPQSRGGWLWLSQDYETKKIHIIDYEFCVDCHTNANERHRYGDGNPEAEFRDYVYFIPGQSLPQSNDSTAGYDTY